MADSVRLLYGHTTSGDARARDWFAKPYGSQDGFDCSFTYFRAMDFLLGCGYMNRSPLDWHPDHAKRSACFDASTEFTALLTIDEDAPDLHGYDHWLPDGYVDLPFLYCDGPRR
ncbi:hypothetical protein ACQ86D_40075 [Streptomyces galilaeus]